METDMMANFDLLVKVVGGLGVIITFIKVVIPKISSTVKKIDTKIRTKITQPHKDLHRRCDELEIAIERRFKAIELDYEKITRANMNSQIGLVAILYKDIYEGCKLAIRQGSITVPDKKSLEVMYEAYHNMGGNGACEDIWNQVDELPIRF